MRRSKSPSAKSRTPTTSYCWKKRKRYAESRSLTVTMAVATLLALGIGIFVAVSLSRGISSATHSVLVRAEAIAAGDLTREDLRVRSQDELEDLTTAINKMSGSLKRIIAISDNATQVASASEELNITSQQITANSEETSAQADVVSKAAQSVSQNLQTLPPAPKRWAPHQGDCQERYRGREGRNLSRQSGRNHNRDGVQARRISTKLDRSSRSSPRLRSRPTCWR